MPGDHGLLPRRQLRIGIAKQLRRLGFELRDLGIDIDRSGARRFAMFDDLRVERCDRFLKF
jgi:hypothetical protein